MIQSKTGRALQTLATGVLCLFMACGVEVTDGLSYGCGERDGLCSVGEKCIDFGDDSLSCGLDAEPPIAGEMTNDLGVGTADSFLDMSDTDGLIGSTVVDAAGGGHELDGSLESADWGEDSGATEVESFGPCSVAGVAGDCISVQFCHGDRMSVPGYCPGPADIQCCIARSDSASCDPNVEMFRPLPISPPGDGACPDGMNRITDFCMDQFEAALSYDGGQYSPYHNPRNLPVVAMSAPGIVPQGYINGVQAEAACQRAGKRLCTSDEWLRACQGPNDWTFPYGTNLVSRRCNDSRAVHPAIELFPNDPNPFDHIQDACINQLPNSVSKTGQYAQCVTPDGIYDLMGNLHEWVADPSGTFRGGFYVDTVRNGPGCLYRTTAHDRNHWDYSTGFRCCADL